VECFEGTYCASGKCAAQQVAGKTCSDRTECVNTAVCDNGICVQMFSLDNGVQTFTIMEPNFFPACKTGYASVYETNFTCDVAPKSVNKGASCVVPSKCMAADGKNYKFCECGLDGKGYCPLFEGDEEVQNMISAWKTLVDQSGSNVCHAMHPYNYACYVGFDNSTLMNTFLNYIQYVELYFKGAYTQLKGSNSCQQLTNLPDYTNIMMQLNGSYPKCPVYNKILVEVNDTCVSYNYNIFNQLLAQTVFVLDCNQTSVCDSSLALQDSFCVENVLEPYLPGQNCTLAHDCLSNNCVDHKCVGTSINGICKTNKDCNSGLYCKAGQENMTCQPVKIASESCDSENPCASNLLCDNSICVALFSKKLAANTTIISNDIAMACSSGFATKVDEGIYSCDLPPQSVKLASECVSGTQCKDKSGKYSSECVCGFGGNAYCSEFQGDLHLQKAIENYLKISNVTCNLALGLTAGCFERDLKDSLYYYYYYTNMTYYLSGSYFYGSYDKKIWLNYFSEYNTAEMRIKQILEELHPHPDDSSSSSSNSDSSSSSSSFGLGLKAIGLGLIVLVN
jgi:hypothetical protein